MSDSPYLLGHIPDKMDDDFSPLFSENPWKFTKVLNLYSKGIKEARKSSYCLISGHFFADFCYSHSLTWSVSGIQKCGFRAVICPFRLYFLRFSPYFQRYQRNCPHFDLTIWPHAMVKIKRLELYYYFRMMRTVSGISQVAFECFFSLAKVDYCGQKFRLAYGWYLMWAFSLYHTF